MGFSSSGSILYKIIANCSCLYRLVASGSFRSCLHHEVVTSSRFLHGSCLSQEVALLVVLVLVIFLLVPNAIFTLVRLVVCLVVVVVIQSSCEDVDWIFLIKTGWIRNQKTHRSMDSYLNSKAHIFTQSDHCRFHPRRSNLPFSISLWMVIGSPLNVPHKVVTFSTESSISTWNYRYQIIHFFS